MRQAGPGDCALVSPAGRCACNRMLDRHLPKCDWLRVVVSSAGGCPWERALDSFMGECAWDGALDRCVPRGVFGRAAVSLGSSCPCGEVLKHVPTCSWGRAVARHVPRYARSRDADSSVSRCPWDEVEVEYGASWDWGRGRVLAGHVSCGKTTAVSTDLYIWDWTLMASVLRECL